MNLINNALSYGGKTITIATHFANHQIILSVKDNGSGIDSNDLEEIKKPFRRASLSRSNPDGAGLGLSIVEQIAQWHNASFELLPNEGGGLHAKITFQVKS